MKAVKALKTVTLGYDVDNPSTSICSGHVTVSVFNRAFKAEGWESDKIRKEDIRHEWWIPMKRKWKKSNRENKKAVPVTVMDW